MRSDARGVRCVQRIDRNRVGGNIAGGSVVSRSAGTLRHSIGDEEVDLHPGDTLVVPAGIMHNAINVGETDADVIVSYSTGTRDFRKES